MSTLTLTLTLLLTLLVTLTLTQVRTILEEHGMRLDDMEWAAANERSNERCRHDDAEWPSVRSKPLSSMEVALGIGRLPSELFARSSSHEGRAARPSGE